MQQMAIKAVGKCPIKMRWGLIELDIPLGTSLHVMNAEISLKARVAMIKFQQTFPDEHHFRTKIIDRALRYELHHVESVRRRGISCFRLSVAKQRIGSSASTSKTIPDIVITCRT